MRNRVIKLTLSERGIESAIQQVDAYRDWLRDRATKLLDLLAAEGKSVATAKFTHVEYDGTNDVKVRVDVPGPHTRAVVAIGKSVLFIEFGTGLIQPEHPETPPGLGRGSWSESDMGKGHWEDPDGWYYAHGKKSRGNRANMSMYESVKYLEREIDVLAKRVFK